MPTLKARLYYSKSTTGKDLVQTSGGFLTRLGKERRCRLEDVIFNWGRTTLRALGTPLVILNRPNAIALAVNKTQTFSTLQQSNVRTVPTTNNATVVMDWLNNGFSVMGRKVLNGHGGAGIIILRRPEDFTRTNIQCRLYTKYIKPKYECRIHVAFEEVIDMAIKKRSSAVEEHDDMVRSHNGGWVFVRSDINIPNDVKNLAKQAIKTLGLDYGAVDIVVSQSLKPYVLEVNTAPGLSPSGLEAYLAAFKKKIDGLNTAIQNGTM